MAKTLKPGDEGYWDWMATQGAKGVGRPKKIKNPQTLWKYACDYFKSVDAEPFQRKESIKSGDNAGTYFDVPNIRPYTWAGFSAYLIQKSILNKLTDYRYNTDGRYSEFKTIVSAINDVMYAQKFEGAAVNAFNSSVISRELQLSDHITTTEKKEIDNMTPDEKKERLNQLMKKAKEQNSL